MDDQPRPVDWLADTREVVQQLPEAVQAQLGYALDRVQRGKPHRLVSLHSEIPQVGKIRVSFDTNTYRLFFTVSLGKMVYILHVFQKKATSGTSTPGHILETVRLRLAEAKEKARVKSN